MAERITIIITHLLTITEITIQIIIATAELMPVIFYVMYFQDRPIQIIPIQIQIPIPIQGQVQLLPVLPIILHPGAAEEVRTHQQESFKFPLPENPDGMNVFSFVKNLCVITNSCRVIKSTV